MLLGIAGVTGVGKSYYKDKIVEKLGFDKVKTITTREMRIGEKNNEDKVFVSKKEFQELIEKGKMAYHLELLGNYYAFTKKELFSSKNMVFEIHYNTIYDLKKICPKMRTIYLFPKNIEMAKEKTRKRHLDTITEEKRILEIEEHYQKITTDENLRNMFDYTLYNNYDKESEDMIINCVKKLILEEKDL